MPFRLLLLIVFFPLVLSAQFSLSGSVSDESGLPIPFANIYVKNNSELRTQTDEKGFYSIQLFPGEYYFVFTQTGYQDRETYVSIKNAPEVRDIQLFPLSVNTLDEFEFSAKRGNPGREIMLKVVRKRDSISQWNIPHTVDVYIKATEKIERKPPKTSEKASDDPFEEEKRTSERLAGDMNLAEINVHRSWNPPAQVREERTGFSLHGKADNLYYTTTVKANFNFFQNLLHLQDLHASPVSSPISGPGILSYKYRLEEQYEEDGMRISKIKIIPRMSSTSTLSGYIYVIDTLWLIQKLELTMEKGNLLTYDYFTIRQWFDHPGDSVCVLTKQEMDYGVKYKDQASKMTTVATFSNYVFNPSFQKKYFKDEVGSTTQEAYERDSTYWQETRIVALTPDEQRFIVVRDSLRDVYSRKEYLDSIDRVFNKVTFWKIAWFGVEHRNREQKTQWTIHSVAGSLRPLYIAGPRVAPGFDYFKKWKDQRTLESSTEVSIGVLNGDIKGNTWWKYRNAPFHQGIWTVYFGHDFDAIVYSDAITQIYRRSNFIQVTELSVEHNYEYFNGFYVDAKLGFAERQSLHGYSKLGLLDSVIPNDDFKPFVGYQALIGEITVSYTPKQKFMREPYRKVVLGSKFPTFYVNYERGIPKLFGSDVDHEYGAIGMYQSFQLGTLGTSAYHFKAGEFLSYRSLKDADFKYQRRSDPFWFSNPLYSYQNQHMSLPSKKYTLEAHFVHHDNGALLNKIPYWKKTGIGLVVGGGALYVSEYNYQYAELFAGLERNFKVFKRRLRVGIYGVISDGNQIKTQSSVKISFAILDDRNMKFNF